MESPSDPAVVGENKVDASKGHSTSRWNRSLKSFIPVTLAVLSLGLLGLAPAISPCGGGG